MELFGRFIKVTLMIGLLTFGIFAFETISSEKISEGEKLALLAKPAVVRIFDAYLGTAEWQTSTTRKTYKLFHGGAGSGAFIDSNGYIVTNAHVVSVSKEGEKEAMKYLLYSFAAQVAKDYGLTVKQLNDQDWMAVENAFRRTLKFKKINEVVIPSGKSYPFEVKSFGAPTGEGKDVAVIKIEIKNAPILKIGNSEEVRVQDPVTVFGYPAAAESQVLDEKSTLQATITDGKVSAKKQTTEGAPIFQINAAATHGSSGGPVVNRKGEIIGLLTFGGDRVNGQQIQGFNFVVASNTVKEFLAQAGAGNEGGLADQSYREGLDLFEKQKYSLALEKFKKVQNLFPAHSEIDYLIQESETKKVNETNDLFWIGIIVAVGAGLIIGGLFLGGAAFFVIRGLKRRQPQMRLV
jgi:S1-C subfamily serine protease